jgi:hypothetical protein
MERWLARSAEPGRRRSFVPDNKHLAIASIDMVIDQYYGVCSASTVMT